MAYIAVLCNIDLVNFIFVLEFFFINFIVIPLRLFFTITVLCIILLETVFARSIFITQPAAEVKGYVKDIQLFEHA